jgi:hypothetical protein
MSGVAMCQNSDCPHHESCWRFNAAPNAARQSYIIPVLEDDKKCEYFLPMSFEQAQIKNNQ